MANSVPVGGYPSKTAYILALSASGADTAEIMRLAQTTRDTIYQAQKNERKRQAAAGGVTLPRSKPGRKPKAAQIADNEQPDATPGIWTPEKLAKARRLFGLSMNMIAEALQVPAAELLAYGLSGVIPPIGERQRVGDLLQQMAGADRQPATIAAPALPPPPDFIEGRIIHSSRDDDEAELAALEEQENDNGNAEADVRGGVDGVDTVLDPGRPISTPVAAVREDPQAVLDDAGGHAQSEQGQPPPAPQPASPGDTPPAATGEVAPRQYRIPRPGGGWVHKSGEGSTRKPDDAWRGNARELEKLIKRYPELRDLDPERAPGT